MEEQVVVNEPAETTAPVESTPIESEAVAQSADTQSAPVESIQPEKRVSDAVPRDRLNEVIEERNQLRQLVERLSPTAAPVPYTAQQEWSNQTAPFDPETTKGVQSVVAQELARARAAEEQARVASFAKKHADDLNNKFLRARLAEIIREGNQSNEYVNHEDALAQAKKEYSELIKPEVKQASAQGLEEGKEIALKKQQAGAVGGSQAAPKLDPEVMSSAEFAEHFNLPVTR